MLLNHPKNCICGKKPELGNKDYGYYYYYCPDCGHATFGTRLEEFCRENWNAYMDRLSGGFNVTKV